MKTLLCPMGFSRLQPIYQPIGFKPMVVEFLRLLTRFLKQTLGVLRHNRGG